MAWCYTHQVEAIGVNWVRGKGIDTPLIPVVMSNEIEERSPGIIGIEPVCATDIGSGIGHTLLSANRLSVHGQPVYDALLTCCFSLNTMPGTNPPPPPIFTFFHLYFCEFGAAETSVIPRARKAARPVKHAMFFIAAGKECGQGTEKARKLAKMRLLCRLKGM